jgi:hypothetical protein
LNSAQHPKLGAAGSSWRVNAQTNGFVPSWKVRVQVVCARVANYMDGLTGRAARLAGQADNT